MHACVECSTHAWLISLYLNCPTGPSVPSYQQHNTCTAHERHTVLSTFLPCRVCVCVDLTLLGEPLICPSKREQERLIQAIYRG